jgi:synaptobrevin family protein YKT6
MLMLHQHKYILIVVIGDGYVKMKVLSITIFKDGEKEEQVTRLESFGYFARSSVKEFINFTSKAIIKSISSGIRQCSMHDDYVIFSFRRADGLGCVIVTDLEYPERVAFRLIMTVLEEFPSVSLESLIIDSQDPVKIDKICRVQKDLDDVKAILYNTIEAVLERQGKLDDLINQSEELSLQSIAFYNASKQNKCCLVQ